MARQGFDNDQYLKLQSQHIRERIAQFGGKLYLEFGGKLFDDFHASRVLPGFEPDSKIRMLAQMKDSAEVIIAINAADIEKNKVRGDLGITYDMDVLRLIDVFRGIGLYVGSVVLTQYNARSLNEHLNSSKWWDFGRKQGGLYIFTPTITAANSSWYRGTADAIYQNLTFLKNSHEPYCQTGGMQCG